MIEKEIIEQGFDPKEILTSENFKRVCEKMNYANEDDLVAAVGFNGMTALQVVNRLAERVRKQRSQEETLEKITKEMKAPSKEKVTETGVIVKGLDNLLIRLSRCCNPVPGDNIVGFITKGRGVSVHRADCSNIQTSEDRERLIDVEWGHNLEQHKLFNVDIEISGFDRVGLLNEVIQVVTETKTSISGISARTDRDKIATISLTLQIKHIQHLYKVVDRVKQIPDVYSVQRVMH